MDKYAAIGVEVSGPNLDSEVRETLSVTTKISEIVRELDQKICGPRPMNGSAASPSINPINGWADDLIAEARSTRARADEAIDRLRDICVKLGVL
jgi:hypothetical protein